MCPRTLPRIVLVTIATSIAGHQLTRPIKASTIITGQTRPPTVAMNVSATDGGAMRPRGTITDPDETVPSTGTSLGSFPVANGGCAHCGSCSLEDGGLVTAPS